MPKFFEYFNCFLLILKIIIESTLKCPEIGHYTKARKHLPLHRHMFPAFSILSVKELFIRFAAHMARNGEKCTTLKVFKPCTQTMQSSIHSIFAAE